MISFKITSLYNNNNTDENCYGGLSEGKIQNKVRKTNLT